MALTNLIAMSFSEEEFSQIENSLNTLEQVLGPKIVNLTPEEKQSLARVGDRMSNWIEKVAGYIHQRPETIPFYLKTDEFQKDMELRKKLLPIFKRLVSLRELDLIIAGISAIETQNYSKALELFQKIPPGTEYYPSAAWYIGLIELKKGNVDMALEYVDVADEALLYVEKADSLREDIEKMRE